MDEYLISGFDETITNNQKLTVEEFISYFNACYLLIAFDIITNTDSLNKTFADTMIAYRQLSKHAQNKFRTQKQILDLYNQQQKGK